MIIVSSESSPVLAHTWSPDQLEAITHRGQNILVAAAAGSGKTAVLVERIIRQVSDEQHPMHIDQLLIATFTNAAAAEMKQRIRDALEKQLALKPQSNHLRKQLAMMGRASIMTIHAFCMEVVRRHVNLTPLDPRFRIANETEIELLKQELLEELLESYYSREDEQSYFWRLVDTFSGDRNDQALLELVQKLYRIAQSQPWPEHWLREMAHMFDADEQDSDAYHTWQLSLVHDCDIELEGVIETLEHALFLAKQPDGPEVYINNLVDDVILVQQLREATRGSWSDLHLVFQKVKFANLTGAKSADSDPGIRKQVKKLRDQAKEQIKALQLELFGRSPEQFILECRQMAPIMHTLVDVLMAFDLRFKEAKVKKSLVDFSDLEHYCLHILSDSSSTPQHVVPSAIAIEYRAQYAEILLDEYQDTNLVQETIIALIAKEDQGNRFMVGDVKQSIYRFRLAEPSLFQQKYKDYMITPTNSDQGKRIDLARNFRSREHVVDAVNFIFKQILSQTVGEIDYDEQAQLVFGATYSPPNADMNVEVILIDRHKEKGDEDINDEQEDQVDSSELDFSNPLIEQTPDDSEDTSELDDVDMETAQLEARAIARRIQALISGTTQTAPSQIWDKELQAERHVTYRDIVILVRATKQWAPIFVEQLQQSNIPAYADLNTGYFTATEVVVMLSLLKIIDNPLQDIPFAAVLRSPIVACTADELVAIRIPNKKISLYQNVMEYMEAERQEAHHDAQHVAFHESLLHKLRHVQDQLSLWRDKARQGSLSDLIWLIYQQTGYYDYVGGLPGGLQRQANLRALYDRARQYEATSLRGLFRFLRFVDRMQDSGGDLGAARAIGEQENVVRIMTIHKSKGLEFPVVFVAGMAKQFNQRDLHHFFLIHKKLGFGPRFVDTDLRISYPTLPSLAIKKRVKLEMLAEEMRVLYVAMTRAREKLIMVGTVSSAYNLLQQWSQLLTRTQPMISNYKLARARCYLDWIGPALIRHPHAQPWRQYIGIDRLTNDIWGNDTSNWQFTMIASDDLRVNAIVSEQQMMQAVDTQMVKRLEPIVVPEVWKPWFDEQFQWTYPHQDALRIFAKTTVSEMKRLSEQTRLREEMEAVAEPYTLEPHEMQPGNTTSIMNPFTAYRRPRFLEQKATLTAAERGTVMHAVMQNIPLDRPPTSESIQQLLSQMIEKQQLTKEQVDVVHIPFILGFFDTSLGQRMLKATRVQREVPFSYGLPASDVYGIPVTTLQEVVLIQGVIDCMFEDEQGLVMLDYKTDATKSRHVEQLQARYALQISLYRRAVEHILKKKVAQAYLYYFDGSHIVDMSANYK